MDYKRLIEAVKSNELDLIKDYVSNGEVNKDKSLLMYAVEYDNLEAAKLLIDKDVKSQDKRDKTALMYAAEKDNVEMVKLLVPHEKGMVDRNGNTALIYAITRNSDKEKINCLEYLAEHEIHIDNCSEKTPLMYALKNNNKAVFNYLRDVYTKVDRHKKDDDSDDSLYADFNDYHHEAAYEAEQLVLYAYDQGKDHLVKDILNNNSTFNYYKDGLVCEHKSLLLYLLEKREIDAALYLINNNLSHNAHYNAAIRYVIDNSNPELIKLVLPIANRLKFKKKTPFWQDSPLNYAICRKRTDIALLLIDRFHNLTIRNNDPAIICAARFGNIEVIKQLLTKLPEDLSQFPCDIEDIILPALENKQIELVNILLARGAVLSKLKYIEDKTIVMYAAESGDLALYNYFSKLYEEAGEPPIFESQFSTLLFFAIKGGNLQIVKDIINNTDYYKKVDFVKCTHTALMKAAINGYDEIIEFIVNHPIGCKEIGMRDLNGKTALMHAAEMRNDLAITSLLKYEGKCFDKNGDTALIHYVKSKNGKISDRILFVLGEVEGHIDNHEGKFAHDYLTDDSVDAVSLLLLRKASLLVVTDIKLCMKNKNVSLYSVFNENIKENIKKNILSHSYLDIYFRFSYEMSKINGKSFKFNFQDAFICLSSPSISGKLASHDKTIKDKMNELSYMLATDNNANTNVNNISQKITISAVYALTEIYKYHNNKVEKTARDKLASYVKEVNPCCICYSHYETYTICSVCFAKVCKICIPSFESSDNSNNCPICKSPLAKLTYYLLYEGKIEDKFITV